MSASISASRVTARSSSLDLVKVHDDVHVHAEPVGESPVRPLGRASLALAARAGHGPAVPRGDKLRFTALERPFRIVLVEPEIPPNTGAVARTCVATSSPLHLVGPLGFSLEEHQVRRAGLDYWPLLDLHRHDDLDAFRASHPDARLHLFSANAERSYLDADFAPGDALVFGRESVGLPPALLEAHPERVWGIPTAGGVRSLNLSNAVAIVLYEALRGTGALARTRRERWP